MRNQFIRIGILLPALLLGEMVGAQVHGKHRLFNDQMPPGAIGMSRRDLRGPVECQFQPVKIIAEGAMVSLAQGDMFQTETAEPLVAGFMIGAVYRIRVTEIPLYSGL